MPMNSKLGEYRPEYDEALERLRSALLAQIDKEDHVSTPGIMAFINGTLTSSEADYVRRHVAACSVCAAELEEMREIDDGLAQAARERERLQAQALVAHDARRQSAWRLGGAALAAASIVLVGILFSHLMSLNRTLSHSASTRQRAIDDLQLRLARKSAAGDTSRQGQNLAEKDKQLAQAKSQAQRLQARLRALEQSSTKLRIDRVAQRRDNIRPIMPLPDPRPQPSQVAKIDRVTHLASPLDRAVKVALAESRLPLSKDFQAGMIGSVGVEMGEGGTESAFNIVGPAGGFHLKDLMKAIPKLTESTFNIIGPAGTNLLTDSPLFMWTPVKNATGYQVVVQDDRGQVVADSHLLRGAATTQWQPATSLPRGRTLHWSVTAQNGDSPLTVAPKPPHLRALFTVLDKTKADAIQRQAASVADSPKALAVLYAQASLLDDAEREVQAWEMTDPGSGVAHAWLAKLRAYRGEKAGDGKENAQ